MHECQGLRQIARQAHFLEQIGNSRGSGRLQVMLEEYNCCLICGAEQIFDQVHYERTGIWKCPTCDCY